MEMDLSSLMTTLILHGRFYSYMHGFFDYSLQLNVNTKVSISYDFVISIAWSRITYLSIVWTDFPHYLKIKKAPMNNKYVLFWIYKERKKPVANKFFITPKYQYLLILYIIHITFGRRENKIDALKNALFAWII